MSLIPDGGGGCSKGFILRNPLTDQTFYVDGDTFRSWIMPKIAEKVGLTRGTVEVCKKSRLYDIFKSMSLDYGGISHKIRKEILQLLVI